MTNVFDKGNGIITKILEENVESMCEGVANKINKNVQKIPSDDLIKDLAENVHRNNRRN